MSVSQQKASPLYNKELSPESASGTWKTVNLFNWWMSAWHSLGGYTVAIGLFALGLMGWQVILAFSIGIVILYFVNNLSGVAGQRVKVPFPVFARASFGVYGANIPALLRAVVAIAWYGIQTYLASAVVMLLAIKIVPGAAGLEAVSFLGLSALGWICFLGLSLIQLLVLLGGMEAVRRLSDFAGPTIWVAMLALAIWVLSRADWSIDFTYSMAQLGSAGAQTISFASAIFIIVAYFAGPSLNFADFTRNAPSEASVRKGNALGLLINAIAFGIISVVIALASVKVYGEAIHDPIALLADIDSITLLLIAIIAVGLATAGINIILNFVSPVYDLINVWPKVFTFRSAGVLVAVLAVVITPWNLFANPVIVNQFVGGVGALMGPLFGVIMTDYYLVKKCRIQTDELFNAEPSGLYYYKKGYNPKAVGALAVAGLFTIVMSVIPAFASWAPLAWPVGVLVGAGLYYFISRKDIVKSGPDYSRSSESVSAEAVQTLD
ncbi:NCS1 family nucleobase:cation symporter-1 [Arthrobacter crystallopoietes]|uniref:Nucleobase:cation symporter-1, NCS1 family n=1 Tax=Crystallibacter crystallopoietes TaxID=37928 RepID=A0A1H1C1S4_9MICC|nr:NCS1 family nucleobase:cation symporter-1 [Arthrobacter crystallopoietes]AUI50914.1 nitrate reductase [Arthrobacter crystallopoietes]SDQ58162.1 nucleobase:cation symporter-1, NCS1 family [Arthrobacter crystallopoietes]